MYPLKQRVHLKKKDQQRTSNDAYAMFLCVFFSDFFFIKVYVVGSYLNCINNLIQFKYVPTTYAVKSKQFKWVPTTYAFIKK